MSEPKRFRELSFEEKMIILKQFAEDPTKVEVFYDVCGKAGFYRNNLSIHVDCVYRIKTIQDSINWDQIRKDFNYMARNESETVSLYTHKPILQEECRGWQGSDGFAGSIKLYNDSIFSSYKKGNVDWKDSLVVRPGFEEK